ncbi:hypothetical protein CR513_62553, partial [Mucuna pruriens]
MEETRHKGSAKRNLRSKSKSRKIIKCFKCKQSKHMKKDCPNKKFKMIIQTIVKEIYYLFHPINSQMQDS